VAGTALMKRRRARAAGDVAEIDLCRGPGNLTRAMGITLADNLLDLASSRLAIEARGVGVGDVSWGPRIGIRVGTERPWRCWITDHPAVSGRRRVGAAVLR